MTYLVEGIRLKTKLYDKLNQIKYKDLRTNYFYFNTPKANTIWRANFYKCADRTSHPHWLTWAPVDYSRPNFHLPQYFGVLEFQK